MSTNLPRLYYLVENKPTLLPEWAYFFMQLGHKLANMPNDNYRMVVGLAIPTRVFACSLVATGIVLGKINNESPADPIQTRYIRNLKPGTHVHVRTDNNKKLRGIVTKFVDFNGKQYISIRTTQSIERCFPVDDYASRITVAERDVNLPKHQQSGYSIETPSRFLHCCLGEELAKTYILDSSFEALIIGKKSVTQHEICDISFICKASEKSTATEGCLQEILQVRQLSGANKSYRIQCVSPSNITPEREIGAQTPPIVVFDGAIAYIKLNHKWRSAHQIILLDRTERQFGDAIELLNQNYAYRLSGSFKFSIRIPDGIEMMIYRDGVQ
jgi:hypothetical protein